MKKNLLFAFIVLFISLNTEAQECLTGGCTTFDNEYPSQGAPYAATNSWQVLINPVSGNPALMNGDNWTRFNVEIGKVYEWTYCEAYGGVSTSWDAELTLFDNTNLSTPLCFSTNSCGTNGNAPYLSWTATFTGVIRILTTGFANGNGCLSNSGTYNKLAYRLVVPSSCTTPGTPTNALATVTGQNSADLSWSAGTPTGSSNLTYYWVVGYNAAVTYGNGVAQGTTTGTGVSISSLTCGNTYYLRVYAKTSCDNSNSGYITSASFSTLPCTSGSVYGIDVSHWQGTIDWALVNASGKVYSFVKATEGITYVDTEVTTNMTNGVNAGVIMGAYHVAKPELSTAVNEANYFLNIASSYIGNGFLPPILDLEPQFIDELSASDLAIWIQTWMNSVQSATGTTPLLYASRCNAASLYPYYANGTITTKLWIADYSNPAGSPANTSTCIWNSWPWVFHQYSNTGSVSGISGAVDLDIFNGDIAAFNTLIGVSASIEDQTIKNLFKIFPNPTNGSFMIRANTDITNAPIEIYNEIGVLIYQNTIFTNNSVYESQIQLNVEAGIYFIKINFENRTVTQKLIVQ
jgi:GH25 family lysozyme M1 (1,4-beta-N-acetylmuramidase)